MRHESKYCSLYAQWSRDKHKNCAGIMYGGEGKGLTDFESYEAMIKDHFRILNHYVYNLERNTINSIGSRYAPVPNSSHMNTSWNGAVTRNYRDLWQRLNDSLTI